MCKVSSATYRKGDIALNIESARKTETSVSFAAQTRTYAAAAIGHQNQGKPGAFSYIKRFLGADVAAHKEKVGKETPKQVEDLLGMPASMYDYPVAVNETRQGFELIVDKEGTSYPPELIMANILQHARGEWF